MWLRSNKSLFRNRSGFTLLELVVAALITVMISTALLMLSSGAARTWQISSGSMSMDNRAHVILSQIEQDLRGLVLYDKLSSSGASLGARGSIHAHIRLERPPSWIGDLSSSNSRPVSDSLVLAGNLQNWRFGTYSSDIRFLARVTDGRSNPQLMGMAAWAPPNLPTMVGYQVVREVEVGAGGADGLSDIHYRLYRSVVRPAPASNALITSDSRFGLMNTYEQGYDIEATAYSAIPFVDDPFAPGTLRRPHRNMMLADGVVDFGIVLYGPDYEVDDPSSSEIYPDYSGAGNELNTSNMGLLALDPNIGYILVSVRLLTEEGAMILSRKEVTDQGGEWWDIVIANSKVYTRLIPVSRSVENVLAGQ